MLKTPPLEADFFKKTQKTSTRPIAAIGGDDEEKKGRGAEANEKKKEKLKLARRLGRNADFALHAILRCYSNYQF